MIPLPPAVVNVILAFAPPKQLTFVLLLEFQFNNAGCVTTDRVLFEQPFASVAVIVNVPAESEE